MVEQSITSAATRQAHMPLPDSVSNFRATCFANGYQPVAVRSPVEGDKDTGKAPVGTGWQSTTGIPASKFDATNTGLLTAGLRAVDIDIDDPERAEQVQALALKHLGGTICRMRANSPRRTLLYSAAEGSPGKVRSKNEETGEQVEVLGAGQQIVAHGQHWTGVALEWVNGIGPDTVPATSLPTVTEDQIATFLNEAGAIIGAGGHRRALSDPGTRKQVGTDNLAAPSLEDANRCFHTVPAVKLDYDNWFHHIFAYIQSAWNFTSQEAISATVHAWCADDPDRYSKRETDAKIADAIRNGTRVGFRDLRSRAILHEFATNPATRPPECYMTREEAEATSAAKRQTVPTIKSVSLPLISAASFQNLPKPERSFLIPELIPARNVTMISGDGGTGKSLLALQLSIAVATGTEWLNRPVQQGNALYFSAEDDEDETHIRLKDICRDKPLPQNLQIAILAGEDALLAVETAQSFEMRRTPLFSALESALVTVHPTLLVLDNLADIFGGNENVKSLARQFIGMLRGLAIRYDCAVLLLSHPSLSGMSSGTGTSGNTAWNNSVRSRLYLKRDEGEALDPDLRVLETMKSNYSATGGQIVLRWVKGRFVPVSGGTGNYQIDAAQLRVQAERWFLYLVERFNQEGRSMSASINAAAYAPKLFAKHPQLKGSGLTKVHLEEAMNNLLANDKIKIVKVGPPSKQRQNIEISG